MMGGQAADVLGQAQMPALETTRYIGERKTASLFAAACRLGALAARADPEQVAILDRFGRILGRCFQIADDLLDVTSTTEVMGKEVAKDAPAGKQTFPQCLGIERSHHAARTAMGQAVAELEPFGPAADDLRALAAYIVARDH